jgi:membrane protease YdiL (CAAX protease family)
VSAKIEHVRALDRAATGAIVLAGSAALLLRLRLAGHPEAVRVIGLGGLYVAMLAVALWIPAPRRPRRARALTLAVGLLGVAVAALAAGRTVAIPWSAWAVPLGVMAAIAEEALFRRVAYGTLEPAGALVAVAGTALLFALIHVPLYGAAAFPVDLGAGMLFGWQRHASGTWTVPAATHAAANLLVVLR